MFDDDFGLSTGQILQKLSSQLNGSYDGGEVKVSTAQRDFFFYIYLPVRGGGRANLVGSPSYFELKTRIPHPHPDFLFTKARPLERVVKRIVGAREHQIDDPISDSKLHVRLHNDDWKARFFSGGKTKQWILDLLNGFDLIHSEDGWLKTIKYLPLGCSYPSAEQISDAIKTTELIIAVIPEVYNKEDAQEIKFHEIEEAKKRRLGCFAILILSVVVPVIFWIVTRFLGLYIYALWQ